MKIWILFSPSNKNYLREENPQSKKMFSEIWHTACPEVGSFWLGPKLSGFYADFTQIFGVHNLYMGFKRILQYFYAGYTEKIRWFPATKNDVNIAVGYMFLRSPYPNFQGTKNGLGSKRNSLFGYLWTQFKFRLHSATSQLTVAHPAAQTMLVCRIKIQSPLVWLRVLIFKFKAYHATSHM